jgi:hypothetical protein
MKRERGFAGFSARELKVIVWRTHGVKGPEIARRLASGITQNRPMKIT